MTYRVQMILSIILIGLGHLLFVLTDVDLFRNLVLILYGLLFLIHPVWSKRNDKDPHIRKKVQIAGVVVMLLGLFVRTGGGDDFWYDRIEESLGVAVSDAVIVIGYDDHSGFHGDGTMYAVLEFSDDTLERTISNPGGWHVLPLTEDLQTLVYGTSGPDAVVGPFIGITMLEVERGYWYFYDRQGDTTEDDLVLTRSSYNYTIAIYDADAERLYYCEYDT